MGQHQSFSHREGDPTAAQRRSGGWRVAPTAQQAAPKVSVALGPACEEEQTMVGAGDGGHEKVKIGGGGGRTRGKVLLNACGKGSQEGPGQVIGARSSAAPPRQPMDGWICRCCNTHFLQE
jgi:hypothetical protein